MQSNAKTTPLRSLGTGKQEWGRKIRKAEAKNFRKAAKVRAIKDQED
jgi:hypothetical protein